MAANLTDAMLRAALQLPPRPYSDPYLYDGNPDGSGSYFDLSRREVVSILRLIGTVSTSAYQFVQGVDYQLTAGTIDWTIAGGHKPDYGTKFQIEYTYSRLGSSSAAQARANAVIWATSDLGTAFPYNTTFANGLLANDVATLVQLCAAAREACEVLQGSDIDSADKYQRGSVRVDDSKKTDDWAEAGRMWERRYRRSLILARGPIRNFSTVSSDPTTRVFQDDGSIPGGISSLIFGDSNLGGVI